MSHQTTNINLVKQSTKQQQQQQAIISSNLSNVINHNNNNNNNPNQQQKYNSKQFDKIRVLGKGSFGVASVNRRRTDCSLVVLKEIDLSKFKGERERLSAINEARIMSTLDHSNIIKYHNAYTTDTKLIIEMEYASIGTLAAFLSFQVHPLDEQEILVIFRQITLGLNYLHSRKIIHLDLKMTNIFVTIEGFIKIGDFGIAQYLSSNTTNLINLNNKKNINSAAAHIGTLAYSSPERCIGAGEPDFKSDIWSLGCILYELITSRPLFGSESLSELIISITRIQYQPIKRNIMAALKETFEQMIALNPLDRPAAKDLLLIINQLLNKIQQQKQQKTRIASQHKRQQNNYQHHRFDISTEMGFFNLNNNNHHQQHQAGFLNGCDDVGLNQINYPHSFVYQVRLSSPNIHLDRVNLPPTKRIKEIIRGKSHYLVLTYDNIVYGWGTKNHGQLGSCGLLSSSGPISYSTTGTSQLHSAEKILRGTRSARSSVNARDLNLNHHHHHQQQQQQQVSITTPHSPVSSLASSTQTIIQQQQQHLTTTSTTSPSPSTSTTATAQNQAVNKQQANTFAKQQFANFFINKQLVMTALAESKPTTRPMVINELNNRKIIQAAAGNNFSVFLSKTGIVMTCGDGSTGCLGRGDLKSSYTPCMVESLLNSDVVSIAAGPEHVVAVCGNGKAFAWGKNSYGRLGINQSLANLNNYNNNDTHTNTTATFHQLKNNRSVSKYITRPRQVQFKQQSSKFIYYSSSTTISRSCDNNNFTINNNIENNNFNNQNDDDGDDNNLRDINHGCVENEILNNNEVFIKSVFCGDKCTIFIDSNNRCWSCGENRFNKLGLDLKRRFKKTLIIDKCWQPSEILALSKYEIITCSIGKNHSAFLTNEGKIILFGQDIDHTYRLKRNIICGRDSHRRISFELQTTNSKTMSNKQQQQKRFINNYSISKQSINDNDDDVLSSSQQYPFKREKRFPTTNYKYLIKSMIAHNQLINFKQSFANLTQYNVNNYQRYNLSKSQRQQIDSYIRKSRSFKKMPIDSIISVSCTPKFTIALSNDNRVYFWGTRTYKKDESLYSLLLKQQQLMKQLKRFSFTNKTNNNNNNINKPEHLKKNSKGRVNCRKVRNKAENYKQETVEPQLVANCSDECFIKIGSTNSSLMSNIELLGSDQPIIHAQDPRLTAQSLADLWILDYKPSSKTSSQSSSSSSTCCSSFCSSSSLASDDNNNNNNNNHSDCSSSEISSSTGDLTTYNYSNDARELSSSCSSFSSNCSACKNELSFQKQHYKSLSAREKRFGESALSWRTKLSREMDNKDLANFYLLDEDDCFKHDAILEAQPIVSLYVPSMFSHSGCSVNLVDLFCFDDDRFYLVLDTTVRLQQHHHTSSGSQSVRTNVTLPPVPQLPQLPAATLTNTITPQPAPPTTTTTASQSARLRLNNSLAIHAKNQQQNIQAEAHSVDNTNQTTHQQASSDGSQQVIDVRKSPQNFNEQQHKMIIHDNMKIETIKETVDMGVNKSTGAIGIDSLNSKENNCLVEKDDPHNDNNKSYFGANNNNYYSTITEENLISSKEHNNSSKTINTTSSEACVLNLNLNHYNQAGLDVVSYQNSTEEEIIINCNSHSGTALSIEEPKSLSTFGASNIILGPSIRIAQQREQSLKPLIFEDGDVEETDETNQNSQISQTTLMLMKADGQNVEVEQMATSKTTTSRTIDSDNNNVRMNNNHSNLGDNNYNGVLIRKHNKIGRTRRNRNSSANKSESTTFTCNEFDETSLMPSWVRNEYIQQQQQQQMINNNNNNNNDDDENLFQVDSSTTEDTYMSELSLTMSEITLASEQVRAIDDTSSTMIENNQEEISLNQNVFNEECMNTNGVELLEINLEDNEIEKTNDNMKNCAIIGREIIVEGIDNSTISININYDEHNQSHEKMIDLREKVDKDREFIDNIQTPRNFIKYNNKSFCSKSQPDVSKCNDYEGVLSNKNYHQDKEETKHKRRCSLFEDVPLGKESNNLLDCKVYKDTKRSSNNQNTLGDYYNHPYQSTSNVELTLAHSSKSNSLFTETNSQLEPKQQFEAKREWTIDNNNNNNNDNDNNDNNDNYLWQDKENFENKNNSFKEQNHRSATTATNTTIIDVIQNNYYNHGGFLSPTNTNRFTRHLSRSVYHLNSAPDKTTTKNKKNTTSSTTSLCRSFLGKLFC